MKQHVIFGAGLIGGFVGGALAARGLSVSLVCRQHVQQKLSKGLKLTDYNDNRGHVDSLSFIDSSDLVDAAPCDFLWLTVKCTQVEAALNDIKPLVGAQTVVFCCQNGLGSEQAVKQAFPDNIVLRVMVPFNVAEPAEGHLHRGSEGALTLESSPQQHALTQELVTQIHSDLMPTTHTQDMQALLWAKLQLNLSNSVNALADIPVKQMLEQRDFRLVIAALMGELLQVTQAQGIALPKVTAIKAQWIPKVLSLPTWLFKLIANKMLAIDPTVRLSMWWDLSQGKKTEIDHLNGAILAASEKTGIPCPANAAIVRLIKQAEQANEQGETRQPMDAAALRNLINA